jgi:hypothetical protein
VCERERERERERENENENGRNKIVSDSYSCHIFVLAPATELLLVPDKEEGGQT